MILVFLNLVYASIISFINQIGWPPAIIILISIVFCVWIFSSSWNEVRKIKKLIYPDLKLAIELIEQSDGSREGFYKNFDQVNEQLKDNKTLGHIWEEFKEHIFKDDSDKTPVFSNSIRPFKFFNLDTFFEARKINRNQIESVSSKLISVGILFTFFGLTWGIIPLSLSIGGDNSELMKGIANLLSGAGVAFLSSLIGMLSSLIFLYYKDKVFFNLNCGIDKLNGLLEKSLKFMTSEMLAYKSLNALKENQGLLSSMDERLNVSLDNIPKNLSKELEPIMNKISEAINKLTNASTDVVDKHFEGSSEKINQVIINLKDTIEGMNQAMEKNMDKMQETLGSMFKESSSDMNLITSDLKSSVTSMNEMMIKNTEETQQKQTHLADTFESLFKNSSQSFNDSMEKNADKMHETLGSMFKESSSDMNLIISDLKSSVASMNEMIIKNTEEAQQKQTHLTDTFEKLFKNSSQSFNDSLEKFSKTLSQMDGVFNGLDAYLKEQKESLSQIENVSKNNQEVVQRYENLTKSFEEVSSKLMDFNQGVNSYIDGFNKMENIWESYEKRFSNIDEETEKFLKAFKEGIQSSLTVINENLKNTQTGVKNTCDSFSTAVAALQETIEDLTETEEED